MLVNEILEYTAARLPNKVALIEGNQRMTYSQILQKVGSLSAHLSETGVLYGDRVALLFPNCIEFCISYFAVLRIGAVAVPLNNRLSPKEFTYIVNDCRPKTLLLGYQFWDTYQLFKDSLKIKPNLIYAGDTAKENTDSFSDVIGKSISVELLQIKHSDPACIMYTSGTTGLPKGAVMSHYNIFINARNCGAHLCYRERDTTLIAVPLFHVTGLNTQLVALFYVGGTVVIMRSYSTAAMIEHLELHKVTTMIAVPTMYNLMLINPAIKRADLSNLRSLAYGGAPMDPQTIRTLESHLSVDLYNCYGLTETSSLTTVMPACDTTRKSKAVGLPVSDVQLRVVDHEEKDVPLNSVGELLVKGPNVISSYWNKAEATAKSLSGGWLRTGDFASLDEEGYVYIADRKKDMINRGGENIYSIEVETAILSFPKVLEVAVVPRQHSIFGEVVHAFVVPVPGQEISESEIIEHCKSVIADYKVPASVSFFSEMPRNPGGKVLKRKLKEMVPPGDPPRR